MPPKKKAKRTPSCNWRTERFIGHELCSLIPDGDRTTFDTAAVKRNAGKQAEKDFRELAVVTLVKHMHNVKLLNLGSDPQPEITVMISFLPEERVR
jgi:hypothetical protein